MVRLAMTTIDSRTKESYASKVDQYVKNPLPVSLTKSVILISSLDSEFCPDCTLFKNKVNQCLGLSVELVECTENNKSKETAQ